VKITTVTATPLRTGTLLVRVETDEGIYGIGEASGRYAPVLKPFIEQILGPIIAGRDPRHTVRLWDDMFFGTSRLGSKGFQTTGIGAIDSALWDISGKAAGVPVYELLGGAARTRIKLYWTVRRPARPSGRVVLELRKPEAGREDPGRIGEAEGSGVACRETAGREGQEEAEAEWVRRPLGEGEERSGSVRNTLGTSSMAAAFLTQANGPQGPHRNAFLRR